MNWSDTPWSPLSSAVSIFPILQTQHVPMLPTLNPETTVRCLAEFAPAGGQDAHPTAGFEAAVESKLNPFRLTSPECREHRYSVGDIPRAQIPAARKAYAHPWFAKAECEFEWPDDP